MAVPRLHALNQHNSTDEEMQHDDQGSRMIRQNVMIYNNWDLTRSSAMPQSRSTPATDLADLDRQVGYMLRQAQLAVFADFIAKQRGAALRPGQFSILAIIGRNPGLSQTQVCSALGIKRANLVAAIDALESLGLVRRDASVTDRRSNKLNLTPAGQRALQTALETQAEHEARITRLLGTAGKRALLKQLAKLCELRKTRSPQ
jgi:DNA-binding MarR family transcriptional regulator